MTTPPATTPDATTATTIGDLHADVLTQILLHLDGPALAAASCADSRLGSLASDRSLWERLCLSAFPSLSLRPTLLDATVGSPRRFFSRAFPFPAAADASSSDASPSPRAPSPPATRLVSAVDLYHRGDLIYSTVVDTETQSQWFLSAPFRIDALERTDADADADTAGGGISSTHTQPTTSTSSSALTIQPEDLTLNWVLIDPAAREAVNLSSRRPVAVERHWYTGETQVRFATVLASGAAAATATVTLGTGRSGARVLEISLSVEDGAEGACLNGKQSLEVLCGATRGEREGLLPSRGPDEAEVRAVARYREFDRKKRERKESKAAREGKLDLCCAMLGASLLLSSVAVVAFGW